MLVKASGVTVDEVGQARLLVYLGDLASPRAQVLLRDLLQLGERPLNLRRHAGQPLTITLRDETGKLAGLSIKLTVELRWRPTAGG
ncbi:MAG TPA: hypothetical protein PKE45_13080 [Caldilineaceae bacterium]|nr:hypothetical protein [Caldilineaceae bacterium]